MALSGGVASYFVEDESELPNEITVLHIETFPPPHSPCRAMWLEVLKDAINVFLTSPDKRLQSEAAEWLASPNTDFNSFISISTALGFEPEVLLQGIYHMSRRKSICIRRRGAFAAISDEMLPRPRGRGHNPYTGNLVDL